MRILREPKNSLIRQYTALLATEGVRLDFTDDAIERDRPHRRRWSTSAPRTSARAGCTPCSSGCSTRSPSAATRAGAHKRRRIDAAYVRERLAEVVKDEDLSRYIL